MSLGRVPDVHPNSSPRTIRRQQRAGEKRSRPKKNGVVRDDEERHENGYLYTPAVRKLIQWARGTTRDGEEWEGPVRTGMPDIRIHAIEYRMVEIEPARRERRKQGSQLRRLRFAGTISENHLWALEKWAADWHAAQPAVKSCLDNREGGRSADGPEGLISSDIRSWRAFDDARAAILAESQMAALISQYVACHNKSPSAAVTAAFGGRDVITAAEATDLLKAGADALISYYRHKKG